jgi:hypothetical protein
MKIATYIKPESLIIEAMPTSLLSGSGTQSDVNSSGTEVTTSGESPTEDPGTYGAAKQYSLWDDE